MARNEPVSATHLAQASATLSTPYDGAIARWADHIGYPAPLMKAIVRQESGFNFNRNNFRYEPLSGAYGDAKNDIFSKYQQSPYSSYLLNGNYEGATANN